MKYVDVKVICWERFHFEEDTDIEEIIKNIDYPFDICDIQGFKDSETLLETTIPMNVIDNEGRATVEIYDGEQNLVWDNVNKFDV